MRGCFTERVHGKRHNWYLSGSSIPIAITNVLYAGKKKKKEKQLPLIHMNNKMRKIVTMENNSKV